MLSLLIFILLLFLQLLPKKTQILDNKMLKTLNADLFKPEENIQNSCLRTAKRFKTRF